MRKNKLNKRNGRYIPLEDIEKINTAFLDELERVKTRLGYVKDEAIIKAFQEVLLGAYTAAIELRTCEREVDYEIKFAEIEERRYNLKPWRRCWLWRLIFQPLTNRAQDIIEERAELDADFIHTAAENDIENERKKLPPGSDGLKLTKRELKRQARKQLKAAIKTADTATINEVMTESKTPAELVQEQSQADCKFEASQQSNGQLSGQMTLDEVQLVQTRRPRPPRSCRK